MNTSRFPRHGLLSIAVSLSALLTVPAALASEGALGRPVTGMQITPYAGVIPPTPGMQWSLGYIHYDGKLGGSRPAPIAGDVGLGLEADLDIFTATGVYIWPTPKGRWNFASMVTVPYIMADVSATLGVGELSARRSDSTSNPYDLYFAPVIAGFHIDEVQHLSFGMYVYAPTADYDPERLANPGLNVWTFSPTVGYTHLYQKGTLEFSVQGAFDIYTENDDTDYQNGVVARAEALLVKRMANGWGVGGVAGWIHQVEDDDGALADRLDGFKGRSLGVGPVLTYGKTWQSGETLSVTMRYVSEFNVKNRFEGDPFSVSVGFSF